MSPLRGLHCGVFPIFVGVTPTLFYVAPLGLWAKLYSGSFFTAS